MTSYAVRDVERLVSSIFRAAGSDVAEADVIAGQLVDANVVGHHSHGVVRVAAYINQMLAGRVLPNRHARVISNLGATAILDGDMGYGQVIGLEAVEFGIKASGEFGVALVGTRNCGHLGRIGYWAERAARSGRASLHFVSAASRGGAQVAAAGGRDRRMAANPMAFGMPVDGRAPVILDFATSEVAVGKVRVARNKGEKLPSAAIIDADGNLTDDPNALFADRPGAVLPFGGHKGYALNLFNDLLGGALTGAGIHHEGAPSSIQSGNNMLSIFIDPAHLVDRDEMAGGIADYLGWLTGSVPAKAGVPVRIPGEGVDGKRERARRDGIDLDDATWEQVLGAGERVGLARTALIAEIGGGR